MYRASEALNMLQDMNSSWTVEPSDAVAGDLKATHDVHVAHAKSDIEADVAKFKASIAELGAK